MTDSFIYVIVSDGNGGYYWIKQKRQQGGAQ